MNEEKRKTSSLYPSGRDDGTHDNTDYFVFRYHVAGQWPPGNGKGRKLRRTGSRRNPAGDQTGNVKGAGWRDDRDCGSDHQRTSFRKWRTGTGTAGGYRIPGENGWTCSLLYGIKRRNLESTEKRLWTDSNNRHEREVFPDVWWGNRGCGTIFTKKSDCIESSWKDCSCRYCLPGTSDRCGTASGTPLCGTKQDPAKENLSGWIHRAAEQKQMRRDPERSHPSRRRREYSRLCVWSE